MNFWTVELVKMSFWYFDICLNKGRLVGQIRAGGGCMRVGETGKYFIRGWNRKAGRGNKDLKKGGGQAGSRGGCLKKRGGWNPLMSYEEVFAFYN